jgi:predicted amidohydrolase
MRVSLCQYAPVWEDRKASRSAILALLDGVTIGDWLILPEMALSGFTADASAARWDGDDYNFFAELAQQRQCWITVGGVQDLYNCAFIFSPHASPDAQSDGQADSQADGQADSGLVLDLDSPPASQRDSAPDCQSASQPGRESTCQPAGQRDSQRDSRQPAGQRDSQPGRESTCQPAGQRDSQPGREPAGPPDCQRSGQWTSQRTSQQSGPRSGPPSGQPVAIYRKRYLFSHAHEDEHYQPGDASLIYQVGGLRVGQAICYDLRFADCFWSDAPRVEAFCVIAAWPAARADHWRTLLAARAIENQCYVIGVNRMGDEGQLHYGGGSAVFDPQGVPVLECGGAAGLFSVDITAEAVGAWRRRFPALRDRRILA